MNRKLRRNTSECSVNQSKMFIYYFKHVSKSFYGEYSMGNLDVGGFPEFGAKREALRDSAL